MKSKMISKWVMFVGVVIFSVTMLMGEFCEDITSIPIKIDYTTTDKNLVKVQIQFADTPIPDTDGDVDGEMEIVESEEETDIEQPEIRFCPETYPIGLHHQTIDLSEANASIGKFKKNLVGIFLRQINYSIVYNDIPSDMPPLKVYVTRQYQGREIEDGSEIDWDTINVQELDLIDSGVGDMNLVMMGTTDTTYQELDTLETFPSTEKRLQRNIENIDLISQSITDSFKFEVVVTAEEDICVEEKYREDLMSRESPIGEMHIKLHMVIVIVVKV